MPSRLAEWTVLACFPAGIFLLLGLLEIPTFLDPCHEWATPEQGPNGTLAPDPQCVGHTATSETKMQAVSRLLLFQGTTLTGLIVALVGAARNRRLLVGIGSGILAAISLPLMTGLSFVFPLASALLMGVGLVLNRTAPSAGSRRA